MGPVRNARQRQQNDSTSAGSSSSKQKKFSKRTTNSTGVQKLKASLRQTRRLLAKDNLAANVRVETERRLKSLEADLARAELARKERTLAVRYHKVKFFERQKVIRKIQQTKRKLSSSDFGEDSKQELEVRLVELRVDLNYILHYPKTKKYVSLFPPEIRKGQESAPPSVDSAKTEAAREEVRKWIRECMSRGDLPSDPEMHVDEKGEAKNTSRLHKPDFASRAGKSHKQTKQSRTQPKPETIDEEDDFFGEEDEGDDDDDDDDDE